jgi:uncharacterized lipoprotein YehR (DUF1307 family)
MIGVMQMNKRLIALAVAMVLTIGMTACSQATSDRAADTANSAGQDVKHAAQDAGQAVNDAAKATVKAVDNAATATGEAVKDAAK